MQRESDRFKVTFTICMCMIQANQCFPINYNAIHKMDGPVRFP